MRTLIGQLIDSIFLVLSTNLVVVFFPYQHYAWIWVMQIFGIQRVFLQLFLSFEGLETLGCVTVFLHLEIHKLVLWLDSRNFKMTWNSINILCCMFSLNYWVNVLSHCVVCFYVFWILLKSIKPMNTITEAHPYLFKGTSVKLEIGSDIFWLQISRYHVSKMLNNIVAAIH